MPKDKQTLVPCALPGCKERFEQVDSLGRPNPSRLYCKEEHTIAAENLRRRHARAKATVTPPPEDERVKEIAAAAESILKTHVALPPVPKLLKLPKPTELRPQEAVAQFSDYHYCQIVDPRATGGIGLYNKEVARERLARWRNGVLRFTQMMQVLMPVETLHLFAEGDELGGHGKIYKTQPFELSQSIIFQTVEFADDMTRCLLEFLQRYKRVVVYKVHGNHGRIGQGRDDLPEWDNLELLTWDMIRSRVRALGVGPEQIDFHITVAPFIVAEIMGKTFLATHGETTKPWSPYAAAGVYNAKLRTNALLGEVINYWLLAHHHVPYEMIRELDGEILGNGSFVGPSNLSVNKMREANLPIQRIFFAHPKYGVTHSHYIHLALLDDIRKVHVVGRDRGRSPAEI